MNSDWCMFSKFENTYHCNIHGFLGGSEKMLTHLWANAERQLPRLEAVIEAEAILKDSRDATKG